MKDFYDIKKKVNLLAAKKELLEEQLAKKKGELAYYTQRHEASQKARILLQEIATVTQKKVEQRISQLVTMALEAVFPDPYKFVLEFVPKRNQTECLLWFEKNGERMKPIDSSGGGAVDVASFALRVAFLSIDKKSRRVVICDEPFRFVSRNYLHRCGEMIRTLSEKRDIQFIIVTHLKELIESADKVFDIGQKT
jgi:DNA repair exonuclease SbcCD ATPase subunit